MPGATLVDKAGSSFLDDIMSWLKEAAAYVVEAAKTAYTAVKAWASGLLTHSAFIGTAATALATPSGSRLFVSAVDWVARFAGRCAAIAGFGIVWAAGKAGDLITTVVSVFSDTAAVSVNQFIQSNVTAPLAKVMLWAMLSTSAVYARVKAAFSSRVSMLAGMITAGVTALFHWAQVIPVISGFAAPIIATLSGLPLVGWAFTMAAAVGFAPLLLIGGAMAAGAAVSLIASMVQSNRAITEPVVMANGDVQVPVGSDGVAIIDATVVPKVVGEYNRNQQAARNEANRANNPNQQRRGK